MLPNPIIFGTPFNIWLGFLAFFLMLLQMSIGRGILKLPFDWHTKIIWKILLTVVLIHAFYGIQIYFIG